MLILSFIWVSGVPVVFHHTLMDQVPISVAPIHPLLADCATQVSAMNGKRQRWKAVR